MKALLWKDCRLNQFVLLLGVVLWLGPYATGGCALLVEEWRRTLTPAMLLYACATYSLILSLLTVVLLGANAIARERSDQSAKFLGYLPPSRIAILTSKLMIGMAVFAVVWLSNLFVAWVLVPRVSVNEHYDTPQAWAGIAGVMVLLYGAAWFGSSFVDTPLTAIGISIVILVLVHVFNVSCDYMFSASHAATLRWLPVMTMSCAGVGSLAAGTWWYLRTTDT